MVDRYSTFKDLAAKEVMGIDYRIRVEDRGTPVTIMAPHGGWIEPGTSDIAEMIAAGKLSFYAFESLRNGPHGDFHITSHLFDEPTAVGLAARSKTVVAIHGRRDHGPEVVWMGGRDTTLRDAIGGRLVLAGFMAEENAKLPGLDPGNICNRTQNGMGVQLELPLSLRKQLLAHVDRRQEFCDAVRAAIANATAR